MEYGAIDLDTKESEVRTSRGTVPSYSSDIATTRERLTAVFAGTGAS
jgi:hypothetical protein